MISREVFTRQMQEIQSLLGVEAKPDYLMVMYKYLANEFTDEEFQKVCLLVMQNEDLYGKMPTVRHFTKYLPKQPTADEEREAKKQALLEKVSDYLMADFITDYERKKFEGISELESRTLRANGGLSEMWGRVHNPDYPAKVSTILRELSQFYDNNYTRENIEQMAQIENRSGEIKSLGEIIKQLN